MTARELIIALAEQDPNQQVVCCAPDMTVRDITAVAGDSTTRNNPDGTQSMVIAIWTGDPTEGTPTIDGEDPPTINLDGEPE